jgi:hypothetical protein
MTAARNSYIAILEHGPARDALWWVRKIQDRHVDLLTVEGGNHVLANEWDDPEVDGWCDAPQMLD